MRWAAKWVGYDGDPRSDLGVFSFRQVLALDSPPAHLPVRISADNRYKLYVNGAMVAFGPQRGDAGHWFYDEVDLAPHLRTGDNLLVALVWNFGWQSPMAQHSVRTAFLMDGAGDSFDDDSLGNLVTPGGWMVAKLTDWDFRMMHSSVGEFYIDVGPGEVMAVDLDRLTAGEPRSPHIIASAEERGDSLGGTPWMLIPRSIPQMLYRMHPGAPRVRRGFEGDLDAWVWPGDLASGVDLPSGSKLLLDYGELLCGYPRVRLFGERGARVRLTYAEALWNPDGSKGDRNEVSGKAMAGYQDEILIGEGPGNYEPLWWRTFRYLMLETDAPVRLEPLAVFETGYPYEVESTFEADDPWVQPIWDVSVRTAKRCAGETYFDCPYYEQLQYAGDTRIQALLGYYLGRDRALQRNAIANLGWSVMSEGLTQSRYPSRQTQVIPPFSLWWVLMLYDQMLYDTERGFGGKAVRMAEAAIDAYRRARRDGAYWHFTDWAPEWRAGVPPGGGHSINEWLARAAEAAKQFLLVERGDPGEAESKLEVMRSADGLRRAQARLPDDADWTASEHAEAMVRLVQQMLGMSVSPWPAEALERENAVRCTYYFAYYKHLAKQPDDYLAELGPWQEMIESGLTTFAENPEPTRSDCHAWSAHPALGFFQHIAGVTSTRPSWRRSKIAPRPGSLRKFDARIAHPDGELSVRYEAGRLWIDSPVPFDLFWQGQWESCESGKFNV